MLKAFLGSFVLFVLMLVSGCGSSQAPTTPTGLAITSTGPITLSWTASSGASSYVVFRGTVSGSITTKTLLAAGVSGTSYTDSPTLVGTTYYYQITAVNSDGQSTPSSEVNATGAFNLSAASSILSWNSITNAASYNVYRSAASDMSGEALLAAGTGIVALTFTDSTAVTGTTYYYRIKAVNASSAEFATSSVVSVTYP